MTTRYLHGPAIDQILAAENTTSSYTPGSVLWSLTDYQNTVRDLLDNSGILVDHRQYDSFGEMTNESNPIDFVFAYTGRELDDTGDQYNRARYYDTRDHSWLSQDPAGFKAGDPNLYRYTTNSPLLKIDPDGLEEKYVTLCKKAFGEERWGELLKAFDFKVEVHHTKQQAFRAAYDKFDKPRGLIPKDNGIDDPKYTKAMPTPFHKTVRGIQAPIENKIKAANGGKSLEDIAKDLVNDTEHGEARWDAIKKQLEEGEGLIEKRYSSQWVSPYDPPGKLTDVAEELAKAKKDLLAYKNNQRRLNLDLLEKIGVGLGILGALSWANESQAAIRNPTPAQSEAANIFFDYYESSLAQKYGPYGSIEGGHWDKTAEATIAYMKTLGLKDSPILEREIQRAFQQAPGIRR